MSWPKIIPALLWLSAAGLCGWIISQLPFATLANTLQQLTPAQWLLWLVLNLGIVLVAGLRWWLLAQSMQLSLRLPQLLLLRQAGQAVSFLTPGPQFGSEPLQILWLYQRCRLALPQAILVVGLDRFYELSINLSVLLLTALWLLSTPAAGLLAGQSSWVLGALLLMLPFAGWRLLKRPGRLLTWFRRSAERWQQHPKLSAIDAHWQQLRSALLLVIRQQKPRLLQALLLSVLGWLLLLAELWLLLNFLALPCSVSDFFSILLAMRLAFLLPLPGGLGTLEAALFWVFPYLGLPLTAVLGLIALMRLRDGVMLLAGLGCLQHLALRQGLESNDVT